jgi:LysM repeat protein
VKSGETLGHIAQKYRTSVRAIQRENNLRGTVIRAGKTLRIPSR